MDRSLPKALIIMWRRAADLLILGQSDEKAEQFALELSERELEETS